MSSQPFFEGDIWRGYITSCTAIRDRNKRTVHVPKHVVDFQVAKAETDGTTAFLYTEHTYGNQYYVQGVYDLQSFQITMEPGEWVKKNTKDFKRCSATAALSRDHGTLAGGVSCPHAPCVAGGGEFVLRHDRTAFRVSGAGRRGAEGEYRNLRPGQSPAHGLFFEGRPVFAQTTCARLRSPDADRKSNGSFGRAFRRARVFLYVGQHEVGAWDGPWSEGAQTLVLGQGRARLTSEVPARGDAGWAAMPQKGWEKKGSSGIYNIFPPP